VTAEIKIKKLISRTKFESAQKGCPGISFRVVVWLGLYPLKIKKIISRTKFESAQRDAPELIPGVEWLGLPVCIKIKRR
jgi:hypothetical protein